MNSNDRVPMGMYGAAALWMWNGIRKGHWFRAIVAFLVYCFIMQTIEGCQALFRSDAENAQIVAKKNDKRRWKNLVEQIEYSPVRLYIHSDRNDYEHLYLGRELEYWWLHHDYPDDSDISYNLAIAVFAEGECKEARELWKAAKRKGHKPSEEMLEAMWRVKGTGWWKRCGE